MKRLNRPQPLAIPADAEAQQRHMCDTGSRCRRADSRHLACMRARHPPRHPTTRPACSTESGVYREGDIVISRGGCVIHQSPGEAGRHAARRGAVGGVTQGCCPPARPPAGHADALLARSPACPSPPPRGGGRRLDAEGRHARGRCCLPLFPCRSGGAPAGGDDEGCSPDAGCSQQVGASPRTRRTPGVLQLQLQLRLAQQARRVVGVSPPAARGGPGRPPPPPPPPPPPHPDRRGVPPAEGLWGRRPRPPARHQPRRPGGAAGGGPGQQRPGQGGETQAQRTGVRAEGRAV